MFEGELIMKTKGATTKIVNLIVCGYLYISVNLIYIWLWGTGDTCCER